MTGTMNTYHHYREGMAAFMAGQYAEAISRLECVSAAEGGESLIARYYLGQAHDRWGRQLAEAGSYREATRQLGLAARLLPDSGGVGEHLLKCLVREGRFEIAADELERALRADPDCVEHRVRLALARYKSGQPLEAIAIVREGIARQPRSAELEYQLGVLLASMGENGVASSHFEAAVARDPSHAGAYERLAQCCMIEGRIERARRYMERAHHLDPAHPRVAWQLMMLAAEGQAPLRLEAAPRRSDVAAMDRLATAILAEPDFLETFLSLPESAVDQEVFSELAATLERALQRHPEYADLHFHCGRIWRRLGSCGEAIAHAERAVQLNPRYVNALILLANLYAQTDRCEESVARLEAAIHAGGDYPDVHYLMGKLYQRVGDFDLARVSYQRALELNENYREAREALAALVA